MKKIITLAILLMTLGFGISTVHAQTMSLSQYDLLEQKLQYLEQEVTLLQQELLIVQAQQQASTTASSQAQGAISTAALAQTVSSTQPNYVAPVVTNTDTVTVSVNPTASNTPEATVSAPALYGQGFTVTAEANPDFTPTSTIQNGIQTEVASFILTTAYPLKLNLPFFVNVPDSNTLQSITIYNNQVYAGIGSITTEENPLELESNGNFNKIVSLLPGQNEVDVYVIGSSASGTYSPLVTLLPISFDSGNGQPYPCYQTNCQVLQLTNASIAGPDIVFSR